MISEEQKLKNVAIVDALIGSFPSERREAVGKMMDGPIGTEYFVAPASARVEHHSCYPGGLCQHSLNVVKYAKKLSDTLCPGKYEDHTLAFVGLFHDLGKVGDGVVPRYVWNDSDWHRERGMMYEKFPPNEMMWTTTADGSLYLLQANDIPVTHEEWVAIKTHDGLYVDENKPYRYNNSTLSLILHWADLWSTMKEKEEVGQKVF